jgi:hypothetical protein
VTRPRRRILLADRDILPGPVPEDPLRYWRQKGLQVGFDWRDVWRQEHDFAFTAAKVMREDVLETLRTHLDEALEQGTPFAAFVKGVKPELEAQGWWGEHEVVDPETGRVAVVKPPRRLALIYDTNMRMARAAGQYDRVHAEKDFRPYLLYTIGPSANHREQHVAWHGLLLSADDPFWTYAFPPNGWNCRCGVRAVSKREYKDLKKEGVVEGEPEPVLDDAGLPTGHVVQRTVPVRTKAPDVPLVPWRNKRTGETLLVRQGIDPGFDRVPTIGRGSKPTPPVPPPVPKPKPAPKPKTPRVRKPKVAPPPPVVQPTTRPVEHEPQTYHAQYKLRYEDEAATTIAWGRAMHERGRDMPLAEAQAGILRLQAAGIRTHYILDDDALIDFAKTVRADAAHATLGDLLDMLHDERTIGGVDELVVHRLEAWAGILGHEASIDKRVAPLPYAITKFDPAYSEGSKTNIRERLEPGLDLYRVLGDDTIYHPGVYTIEYDPGVRASHNGRTREIVMGEPHVYAHEVAHALELENRNLHEQAQAFIRSRRGKERLIKLSTLNKRRSYAKHEKSFRDKLVDFYIGRDYGGRASEVSSVGFEALAGGTITRFVKGDREYFYLLLGQLAGTKVPK